MSNNATVAGILSIVSGVFGFLFAGLLLFSTAFLKAIFSDPSFYNTPYPSSTDKLPTEVLTVITIFYAVIGLFYAVLGILAIAGGVCALQKKRWGVALAGAIAGTMTFMPCGIPALIFVTLGKPEFSKPIVSQA